MPDSPESATLAVTIIPVSPAVGVAAPGTFSHDAQDLAEILSEHRFVQAHLHGLLVKCVCSTLAEGPLYGGWASGGGPAVSSDVRFRGGMRSWSCLYLDRNKVRQV